MDRSSIKLFLAVVLGILAIFFVYVAVAAWNGVPISKVGYTYIRYVALFLGASLTVWIAGKFVQQYNSRLVPADYFCGYGVHFLCMDWCRFHQPA